MVRDVEKAIQDSASTPQGQQIRSEASRAAESLKTATHQTVQEVRPHLVDALQQLNNELQRLIQRMENKEPMRRRAWPKRRRWKNRPPANRSV